MILFILILILIVVIIRMVYLKKIVKWMVVIGIACIALILVHISGQIISKMEIVSEEVVEKILGIPWDDIEYLHQLGFKDRDNELVYDEFKGWSEDGHASYFCIHVEKMDKERAIKEYDLKWKNDVLMKATKSNGYSNVFSEFIGYGNMTGRLYSFYLNDCLVSVHEHNAAGREKFFEPYIMSL